MSCQKDEVEITQQDINQQDPTKPDFLTKDPTQNNGIQKYGNVYYLNPSTGPSDDNTGDFQTEIDKMGAHDILVLRTGTHYLHGTVDINKPHLIIYGEPGCVIKKAGAHVSCIDLNEYANYTRVDNIHIDGERRGEPCMRVFSNHNYIVNSKFNNCGSSSSPGNPSGLLLDGSHLNIIEGCQFYGNHMVGLSQWKSGGNEIKYCQMQLNGAEGITVDGHSHNVKIHHNWIHDNNSDPAGPRGVGGIGIDASNGTRIYNNTIDLNGIAGITFQNNLCGGCDGAVIYNNAHISNNGQYGILKRLNQPVTNFGEWGNNMAGNPDGNIGTDPTVTGSCIPV